MALVTYIEHTGTPHQVEVANGDSVMQGAIGNMIPGIAAECGGALSCATCHCYVDDAWIDRIPPPAREEVEMLESTAEERQPTSRLSCQITIGSELDGLVVRLPAKQF